VRKEHEYARSLGGKRLITLTLSSAWEAQQGAIGMLLKSATVFLSYAAAHRDRVRPFADLLSDRDFAVWTDLQLQVGQISAIQQVKGGGRSPANASRAGGNVGGLSVVSAGVIILQVPVGTERKLWCFGVGILGRKTGSRTSSAAGNFFKARPDNPGQPG
jgi:hypothetical protein